MGHNPWEDLHKNMERVFQQQVAGGAGSQALVPRPMQMQMQLGGLLDMFGDHHAGHVGLAQGSFQVHDDHETQIVISAVLPGYEFGAASASSEKPLSVRAIRGRSLVISGRHRQGPLISSWQRVFSLPKGADVNHVSVTYSSGTGNLTVTVPRTNETVAEEPEGSDTGGMDMLPPALQALRTGVPLLVGNMGALQGGPQGFLRARRPVGIEDVLNQVFGQLDQMHPRNQLPVARQVPEDAVVNLVGCFAESQLEQVKLKYYGDENAANFAAMYWHAENDHVPYFAMARHGVPLGHAFTAAGFLHEKEVPQWGVYDGCGSPCQDDDERWCGCANEASRGFANPSCVDGEKRFAVYKIGAASTTEAPAANATAAEPANGEEVTTSVPSASAAPAAPGPYWKLTGEAEGDPSIEVVVPKGTVASASGSEVLLFNATATEGASSLSEQPPGTDVQEKTPIGKVKLPVDVSKESCKLGETAKDGGQVLKCKLEQEDVREVPIKVIDEL
ncbi:MLH3 [Symbiodinium natans]|uniref:MLH3 protein n=1 Tax=Symbiodinium natans TaxID=878477 RepID=A0A812SLA7_9DINO|nr:MLH3 [Symbiodinium natans]